MKVFSSKLDNKYRYLYKITNILTGQYYYGIHTTLKLNDRYMGSGRRLKKDIKIFGIENFKKDYICFFEDEISLRNAEREIVNIKTLNDPLCYNIAIGGGPCKGVFPIKNILTGEIKAKPINEDYDKSVWVHITTGRKRIHKIINGVCVNKYIYKCFIDEYLREGWILGGVGTVSRKIKINNGKKVKYIYKEKLEEYIERGWKRGGLSIACKGNIRIINNSNTEEKLIKPNKLEEYIERGWKKGSLHKGRIHIYRNDNEHKMIFEHELKTYIKNGWILGSNNHSILGKIKIIKDNKCIVIDPLDLKKYEDDGWVKGSISTTKGKIVVNKNNKNKFILPEELDNYISNGWNKGKKLIKN